jgi:single-stranded-DNA-specific exonuclease
MKIVERPYSPSAAYALVKAGIPAFLARVYAARGIKSLSEISNSADFLPHTALKNAGAAADMLIDAIKTQRRILIISDYDADGATACSIAIRGLTAFGANVGYLVPNRFDHGYGLTVEIVQEAALLEPKPSLIITVDNGISSHIGIDRANELGMEVLVTDHHLPADTLPNASLIVNPNRKDDTFPSKSLAGCGVMWYVLWALEEKLLANGVMPIEPGFTIESLLPLLAIGTVADVVILDENNRALVRTGLDMIRTKTSFVGIEALAIVARRDARQLTTGDIGFAIGPRINAAGRLESMKTGIECLTTNDPEYALELAKRLHEINDTRRKIEVDTVEQACKQVADSVGPDQYTAVAFQQDWHKGVVGIVASRIRELVYRPTFIFGSDASGKLTGSGRSIPGFNLRDALDLISKREPGLILKFGGHAVAAGCTLREGGIESFMTHFEAVARSLLTPADLNQQLDTDGELEAQDMTIETVDHIRDEVWGNGFLEPTFKDTFTVIKAERIGEDKSHIRMTVVKGSKAYLAVKFRAGDQEVPSKILAVYKLGANTFRGATTLQLLIDHFEPAKVA